MPEGYEWVKSIKSMKVFNGLSEDQLLKFSESCEVKSFSKGEKIIREGEMTRDFYILLHGGCDIEVEIDKRVKHFVIGSIEDHGIFGEMSFLDSSPRLATVVCTRDSRVVVMSSSNFEKLTKEDPAIWMTVVKNLAFIFIEKIRETHTKLKDIFCKGGMAV